METAETSTIALNEVEKKEENQVEKKKKKKHESYSTYIYKVLKDVDNDMSISNMGMNVMQSFVEDLFGQLVTESQKLCALNGTKTMTDREIKTAIRLLFPPDLAKHTLAKIDSAVKKFNNKAV